MTDNQANRAVNAADLEPGQEMGGFSGAKILKAIRRMLIVDDNPEDRADLRRMLLLGSDSRYRFTEAETGAACLQVCLESNESPPDCVILDYHLPDYDAPELLRALGGPEAPCCPVLVVTGSSGRINSGAILGLGAQDFISKNWINPESLTRSVENAIERYWLNQELISSHRRFKAFLENSAVIAWMKNEKGCYSYLSQNFERRFNIRFEDWYGKTDYDVWPERIAEIFRNDDLKVITSKRPLETVEEATNPDGGIGWWLTSKFPFKDQSGRMFVGGLAVDITERKHAELALQDSEEFIRSVLDHTADCIKVIGLEGELILMNAPGQCAMEIDDLSTCIGKPWASLWPDPNGKLVEEALQTARLGGIGRFQGFCPTAKGAPKWWEVVVTAVFDSAGQPKRYISISRDITERKQAEDVLRLAAEADAFCITLSDALRPLYDPIEIQSKASRVLGEFLKADRVHYGEVIENGAVGLVSADYCAGGVSSVVGRHRLDEYGPLVMTEIRAGRILVIPNVAEDPRLTPAEKARTAKLGIGAYVLAPLLKDMRLAGLLAVHQVKPRNWTAAELKHIMETADRTWEAVQRGHIEKKLRTSEARLAAIVQQASAGLAETDLSGRFILVNEHFCAMVGRSQEELLTLRWQDITFPDDLAANEARFLQCVTEGRDFVIEKRYLRPDGDKVWVRNRVTLLREANGQAMSALAVSFDIGERKKNEILLQEQAKLLNEADKRKDEFLAMLAHELRNPLAPIRNAVEIQKVANNDPSRISWCTNIIDRQVHHLTGLVDDLLDVSRISRGLIELKKEILEIRDIIKPAVETNQPLIDSRRQIFRVTLPPEPLWIEGDRIRLAQILSNLINNAAKYTQEEGAIGLIVEPIGNQVLIRVTDNGYGIDQASMAHLFELFYQVDHNLDHSQGGLGIGLSIVHRLVEMHGGAIQAFSAGKGKGSEFAIRLPRVMSGEISATLTASPSASISKLRILVVDDNQDIAKSLAVLMEMGGHVVDIANDSMAALEIAQAKLPDIILMDIGLPGMNGYALAQALRRNKALSRTLLIAVTGYGQPEDREKSYAAGFDAHLVKPVDYDTLRKLLAAYPTDLFDELSEKKD